MVTAPPLAATLVEEVGAVAPGENDSRFARKQERNPQPPRALARDEVRLSRAAPSGSLLLLHPWKGSSDSLTARIHAFRYRCGGGRVQR